MHSTAAEKNKQGESTHKMESCFNFVSYHSHAVLNQQMQQSRASLAFIQRVVWLWTWFFQQEHTVTGRSAVVPQLMD